MDKLRGIVYLLWFSSAFATREQFLRFIPAARPDEEVYYYESPGSVSLIEINASISQQVRIRISDYLVNEIPKLLLRCIVEELADDALLVSAYICRKVSLSGSEECIDDKDRTPAFSDITFTASGDRQHGYSFYAELQANTAQLDGFYYCKFRNKRGDLTSNYVQIQNAYYYKKMMVDRSIESARYLPTLTPDMFPMQLDCGRVSGVETLPDWADHSFPSPFRWSFCRFSGKESEFQCLNRIRHEPIRVSDFFENTVYTNGTLVLYRRTATAWKDVGLLCTSHLRPEAVYSAYFGGDETHRKPISYDPYVAYPSRTLKPFSPLIQNVKLEKSPHSRASLSATYQANQSTARAVWAKDGGLLPPGFPTPTPYILTFPESIQNSFSGTYTLTVTDGSSQLEFRYYVDVVGPPEVVRPSPSLLLVMEGRTAEFECEIDGCQTRSLEINGVQFFPSSSKTRAALIEHFPYLKDVNISPLDVQGSRLKYRATNLLFTPGSAFGSSHTVTISGANLYGFARVSTFINVLPSPKVLDSPTRYHCLEPCLSSIEHVYDCKFDLTRYQMARVEQTWDLNGLDLSKLREDDDDRADYLITEGTKLKILPVVDPTKAELFASSNLTCRLRIFNPTMVSYSRLGEEHAVVYDSRTDPILQPLLTGYLHLQPDAAPPPATANISWIAAVIIAVIAIIAIGALTACIVMRTRGETYMLEREERALGNDPEREWREKEAFRTYERAEEPPLRGSRCSLNDDSAEIGSDADGELDDYNLDPGKFNEEGSFIDQYATETHYKGASRLPTLTRQYDRSL